MTLLSSRSSLYNAVKQFSGLLQEECKVLQEECKVLQEECKVLQEECKVLQEECKGSVILVYYYLTLGD